MKIKELLNVLRGPHGDSTILELTTIDIVFSALPEDERATIKTALMVAAIPHWCDVPILADLLQVSQSEAAVLFNRLHNLKVVESFPARGANAINVHEATRLILREGMACDQQDRFRALSFQAKSYFETDMTTAGRIEWIYHFLIADPDRGATACEVLNQKWTSKAYPENRFALALALEELETSKLLVGLARIEALLCIGETRSYYGETAQLGSFSEEILSQTKSEGYLYGEARAYSLLGDSFYAQRLLKKAYKAYKGYLHISQKLIEQDPLNESWQLDLAIAYSKVGDVLQEWGHLSEAKEMFEDCLHISLQLFKQDSSNVDRQRRLAIAHSKVGGVLQAQGQLSFSKAKEAFDARLRINLQMVEQDPKNAGWQRDLAVAFSRVGDILKMQGRLREAKEAFEERLHISRKLVKQDFRNAGWRRELAVAHSKLGDVLLAQNQLSKAKEEFDEDLLISRELVEQDSRNAGWQQDLAITLSKIGYLLQTQGELRKAKEVLEESLCITRQLVERDPSNVDLCQQMATAHSRVEGIKEELKQSPKS